MKNTLNNKTKFFAHYFGQTICVNKYLDFDNCREVFTGTLNPNEIFKYYLKLKSISSITDDHARQLGFRDSEHFKIDANEYGRKDELRLLGYAIEWADLSVEDQIKYGWIKLF